MNLHFVSVEKAINYYSRRLPAHSQRDARAETKALISAGEICIGPPDIPPGQKLSVVDCGTRYALEPL